MASPQPAAIEIAPLLALSHFSFSGAMSTTSLSEYQSCDNLQQLAEPFQFDDANVIIRAGEVDFPAHRFILARASPVFKDMFSLPRDIMTTQERTPVIEVEEDAQTIHAILSLLYEVSGDDPAFDSLSEIQSILLAARKYSMETLQARFAKTLEREAQKDPIQVFVLACRADLVEVARIAATQILAWDFVTLATCDIPEFAQLRISTVLKLLRYHRSCGEVASKMITFMTTRRYMKNELGDFHFTCECPCPVEEHNHKHACDRAGHRVDCREWWTKYMDRIKTDSRICPLGVAYKDLEFLNKCCRNAHACPKCQNALYHLMRAGELLERGVREAVAEVQLELDDNDFVI